MFVLDARPTIREVREILSRSNEPTPEESDYMLRSILEVVSRFCDDDLRAEIKKNES